MEASQQLQTTQKEKARNLLAVIEARKDAFKDLLPKYLTPEKLFRVAQLAISKQPLLLQCTPASFVVAMMDAARSGLEPNGKDAALVPYGKEVQFQPMYQGLIRGAIRGGAAKKIAARVVHANDFFTIKYDPEPHIIHEPSLTDEGDIIGAYAYAILPDDSLHIEWMNRRQLDAIRNRAKSKSGPWMTDTEEMFRKTPVKRLFKYLPVPENIEYAVQVDNAAETGSRRDDVPLLESVPDAIREEAPTRTAEVVEKLKRGRPAKSQPVQSETPPMGPSALELSEIREVAAKAGMPLTAVCDKYGVSALEELDQKAAGECLSWLLDLAAHAES